MFVLPPVVRALLVLLARVKQLSHALDDGLVHRPERKQRRDKRKTAPSARPRSHQVQWALLVRLRKAGRSCPFRLRAQRCRIIELEHPATLRKSRASPQATMGAAHFATAIVSGRIVVGGGQRQQMQVHSVVPRDLARLVDTVGPERVERTAQALWDLAVAFAGRRLVNVTGDDRHKGGVYEILRTTLPYLAGGGIDVAWVDVTTPVEARGSLEFAHVLGHGCPPAPDWREAVAEHRALLGTFGSDGAREIGEFVRSSDVVVLHDTQTALLAPILRRLVHRVAWHAHTGARAGADSDAVDAYWSLFGDALDQADGCVFYLSDYVPGRLRARSVTMVPSIDPSSAKSQHLAPEIAHARLTSNEFVDLISPVTGSWKQVYPESVLAVQVSRWDPLKDMAGVVEAFGAVAALHSEFQGLVVGTVAQSDNEQRELNRALVAHSALASHARPRVHVWTVGASGTARHDEAIRCVQSAADIAVQKSLQEAFGLTVTEAMLRGKPVVGSRVGGIPTQIHHQVTGLLVNDPRSTTECVAALTALLDRSMRQRLGTAAREAALRFGTVDRHLREISRHLRCLVA
jgi:trehalose synthase